MKLYAMSLLALHLLTIKAHRNVSSHRLWNKLKNTFPISPMRLLIRPLCYEREYNPNFTFQLVWNKLTSTEINTTTRTKTILQHLTLNPTSISKHRRVDTHHCSCCKSLKTTRRVYEAAIIRRNLPLLPVRRLQITVLFGRYHYWSLVDPPSFWQDVTWSVFSRGLNGGSSWESHLKKKKKKAYIIPEHYGWRLQCVETRKQ